MSDPKPLPLKSYLSISKPGEVYPVARALASMERLEILNLLCSRSMNVKEISEALRLPMSSAAMHLNILEDAGLITSVMQPGSRGNIKLCSKCVSSLRIALAPRGSAFRDANQVETYELPLGAYSQAINITPTCGLGSQGGPIGEHDLPGVFYHPKRLDTQILWFRSGFLEYRFPPLFSENTQLQWLEFSFEGSPQTASYHAPWKSDISVYINGIKLGVWESQAERSVRHGLMHLDWWDRLHTQYGELKTWRITSEGCYLDSQRISSVTLEQLGLDQAESICVRVGVEPDAEHIGGLVLFGQKVGDHAQSVILRMGGQSAAPNR